MGSKYTPFSNCQAKSVNFDSVDHSNLWTIVFQMEFVWIVSAVLLKMYFKEYSQKTFTYSYDVHMYGTLLPLL